MLDRHYADSPLRKAFERELASMELSAKYALFLSLPLVDERPGMLSLVVLTPFPVQKGAGLQACLFFLFC